MVFEEELLEAKKKISNGVFTIDDLNLFCGAERDIVLSEYHKWLKSERHR